MAAISSMSGECFFILKHCYFNSHDTISLLNEILTFHQHKEVVIFWDNATIHKSGEVKAFIEENPRLTTICNLVHEPFNNGIESMWNYTKLLWKRRLTMEKLKLPVKFNSEAIVEDIMMKIGHSETFAFVRHGWKSILNDKRNPV